MVQKNELTGVIREVRRTQPIAWFHKKGNANSNQLAESDVCFGYFRIAQIFLGFELDE